MNTSQLLALAVVGCWLVLAVFLVTSSWRRRRWRRHRRHWQQRIERLERR